MRFGLSPATAAAVCAVYAVRRMKDRLPIRCLDVCCSDAHLGVGISRGKAQKPAWQEFQSQRQNRDFLRPHAVLIQRGSKYGLRSVSGNFHLGGRRHDFLGGSRCVILDFRRLRAGIGRRSANFYGTKRGFIKNGVWHGGSFHDWCGESCKVICRIIFVV